MAEDLKEKIDNEKLENEKLIKIKLALESLTRECDYETSRSRNFENKAYIALVIITFLIQGFFQFVNDKSIFKVINSLEKGCIIDLLILITCITFYALISICIYNLIKVIEVKKISRLSLDVYGDQFLTNVEVKPIKYFINLKKKLVESIKITREQVDKKTLNYNLGLKYLKLSLIPFLILLILEVIL